MGSVECEIPKDLDFLSICRCCLLKLDDASKLRPLFGSAIDAMLREVTRVGVQQGDGLPEQICVQCVLQVSRAFSLKSLCEKSDNILRTYLGRGQSQQPPTEYEIINNVIEFGDSFDFAADSEDDNGDESRDETDFVHLEILSSSESDHREILSQRFAGQSNDNKRKLEIEKDIYDEVLGDLISPTTTLPPLQSSSSSLNCSSSDNLTCPQCHMPYDTRPALDNHLKLAHSPLTSSSVQCECDVCGKVFASQKTIRRHMKIHYKPHACPVCSKSFADSSNLTKHLRSHTGELRDVVGQPLACPDCGKRFKWATSLAKHRKYHTGRNLFACSQCSKVYVERKALQIHLRTHSGDFPFACSVCERRFNQQVNLTKHQRLHTGERPFGCPVCEKVFAQSSHLKSHLRSHSQERPFSCNLCNKAFTTSSALRAHEKAHRRERPFGCRFCPRWFARKEAAEVHEKKVHSKEEEQMDGLGLEGGKEILNCSGSTVVSSPKKCSTKSSREDRVEHVHRQAAEKPKEREDEIEDVAVKMISESSSSSSSFAI